ncbi:hypothetical protein [Myxococcus sp. SDU36]|uniref:hypothetical protein n=1 Tax=Myxococcus sp. SDU36 TaxID=2831967 RepID=UPI002542E9B9|nr:hypothetical protein [Myxococcus sp. SDU36]WIG95938.1 hypothetical protein KGD87_00215 [Myxococcus sp. SDU36]
MNLIECSSLAGALAGSCVGGVFGYQWAGVLGAGAGAVGGLVLGLFPGPLIGGGLFWVVLTQERWSRRKRLRPRLGRYWTRDRAQAWVDLKERLPVATAVQGTVILRESFGCHLDIGVAFPARIDSWNHPHDDPDPPPLDARVEATVRSFDDENREVVLTRKEQAPPGEKRPSAR